MRLELSSLLMNVELSDADRNQHVKVPFFDPKLLQRSEFIFKNHLIQLKDTDLAMLNEALKLQEEETAKRLAAEKAAAQQATQPTTVAGKKPDPKKDAGKVAKPPAKGAVVVEDPNQPKDIQVDYPECPSLPDYVVIDRTHTEMRANSTATTAKPAKVDPNIDKKSLRLAQL